MSFSKVLSGSRLEEDSSLVEILLDTESISKDDAKPILSFLISLDKVRPRKQVLVSTKSQSSEDGRVGLTCSVALSNHIRARL